MRVLSILVGLTSVAATIFMVTLCIQMIWAPGETISSWVQAVGSIIAVGTAAGIAVWQNSKTDHRNMMESSRSTSLGGSGMCTEDPPKFTERFELFFLKLSEPEGADDLLMPTRTISLEHAMLLERRGSDVAQLIWLLDLYNDGIRQANYRQLNGDQRGDFQETVRVRLETISILCENTLSYVRPMLGGLVTREGNVRPFPKKSSGS